MPDPLETLIEQWLEEYAGGLVQGITQTTREAIEDAVAEFLTGSVPLKELEARIAQTFGADRALRIAVTEVTRAYDFGDQFGLQEARNLGFKISDIWRTANDDLVDPDCAERQDKPSEEWSSQQRPPLHPNCRCTVTHEWIE
jgi:hypothetical protein